MSRRISQIQNIDERKGRYNGWLVAINSALITPNFTTYGWGITRAPEDIVRELKDKLYAGLKTDMREEHRINVIETEKNNWFIPLGGLTDKILRALQPMHEKWSGIKLQPATAYGLRLYRNNSSLLMHCDKPLTHIVSSILHVDHSPDSEPWPLLIEDYEGYTNEVILESGDMLFYESSKCLHGRPKKLKGSWYTSLFIHYYPVGWDTENQDLESHYAVPPDWHIKKKNDGFDELQVIGTGFKEPSCEHEWCAFKNTRKWYGPAKEGVVMSTNDYAGETQNVENLCHDEKKQSEKECSASLTS